MPFAPTRITLSQNDAQASAAIIAVDTEPSGDLAIPPDSAQVGWWRSGALAGDAFGSVVLAGHVDTARYGVGYFARLLKTETGDTMQLSDSTREIRYRVTSVREVPKNILSSSTDTFSQSVPGRLVLLTCTGTFNKAVGHHDHNSAVLATPIDWLPVGIELLRVARSTVEVMSRERVLAIVQAGGRGSRMDVLTRERAKPALAFGGCYSLIDFALSSLSHSGISDVWVSVQYLASSLDMQLAGGRPWDLDRTRGGFRRLVPEEGARSEGAGALAAGNADDLLRFDDQIRTFDPTEVVVLSSDHVFALDLRDVLNQHRHQGASCTLVTTEVSLSVARSKAVVDVGADGRATGFAYKPSTPSSSTIATEIFVYDGRILLDTLDVLRRDLTSSPQSGELGDFGDHLLPRLVDEGNVWTYPMQGYWRDVGQPELYLAAHRDLLAGRIDAIGKPDWPILSRFPESPPALVRDGAVISDSVINPGCEVRGTVRRSVLAPGVIVESGAVIEDCVIGHDVHIGAGARLHTCIVDDHTRIGRGAHLGSEPAATRPGDKDIVLVGQGCDVAGNSTVEPGARLEPGTST